jgi:hypothetical protein
MKIFVVLLGLLMAGELAGCAVTPHEQIANDHALAVYK